MLLSGLASHSSVIEDANALAKNPTRQHHKQSGAIIVKPLFLDSQLLRDGEVIVKILILLLE